MMLVSIGAATTAAPTSYSPGEQFTRIAERGDSPARPAPALSLWGAAKSNGLWDSSNSHNQRRGIAPDS